jgi:hypothetical protein
VLTALFAGLFFADHTHNNNLGWFFGLSLMAALPAMLLLAIGSAIGSSLRKRIKGNPDE